MMTMWTLLRTTLPSLDLRLSQDVSVSLGEEDVYCTSFPHLFLNLSLQIYDYISTHLQSCVWCPGPDTLLVPHVEECHVSCAMCHGSQGPVHVILESPLQSPSQMDGQLEYLRGWTDCYHVGQPVLFGKLLLFYTAPFIHSWLGLTEVTPHVFWAALCTKAVYLQATHSPLNFFSFGRLKQLSSSSSSSCSLELSSENFAELTHFPTQRASFTRPEVHGRAYCTVDSPSTSH